jgi:hypothetical protein
MVKPRRRLKMEIEQYLEDLLKAQKQIQSLTLRDYYDKCSAMFKWILNEGFKLIGDEVAVYQKPLWHINYTKDNQFEDIRKTTSQRRKDSALSDLIRHFDHDLDLLIRQVQGIIDQE